MAILIVLIAVSLAAVVAAIRSVTLDGYRRVPTRDVHHVESTWSWR